MKRMKNGRALLPKIPLFKGLVILFIFAFVFEMQAKGFSQNPSVTLNYDQVKVEVLMNKIEQQTGMSFLYNVEDIDLTKKVSIHAENDPLSNILDLIFPDLGLEFKIEKNQIILFPKVLNLKNIGKQKIDQNKIKVTGTILDADSGEPVMGATVINREARRGVAADFDGKYVIETKIGSTLTYNSMGYTTKEIVITRDMIDPDGTATINVSLKMEVGELSEVLITGIVERDKTTFTGATNSIKGEELKAIGNQNIIQSLKSLDPSMVVVENNIMGSDPNALPNIEIRGKTSVPSSAMQDEFGADPNTPLFVLDGFETDLQTVMDLDINRVKEISILKDAASTALYGAKAANGVVVIETVKPKEGDLRFSYTGDFMVQFADLSDYNLMNAEEKIEYEKLAGRFTHYINDPRYQYPMDSLYNHYLGEVERGVDTYWLSKPIQTVFTQKHSMYAEGGSEGVLYGVGLNLGDSPGVMKGSKRNTYGANINLTYRKGNLNISNRLTIDGVKGIDSPYGSFSKFASANPYYRPEDENGHITKYLDEVDIQGVTSYKIENPLYSSTLNNESATRDFNVRDNLNAIWTIDRNFRVTGGLQLIKRRSKNENFISPESPQFDEVNFTEKGSYRNTVSEEFSYRANVMLSYAKVFENVHSLTVNLRGDVEETKNSRYGTEVVGFPVGSNGNPNFAFQYKPDGRPSYSTSKFRRNNFLVSANYAYNQKYLLDATYRLDGSTVFGSNKHYTSFWSVGLGWNIHKEFNLEDHGIDMLKIRGNIGSTGNQNFGSLVTTSVYNFNNKTNIFGQGIGLESLASPDLEWQKTLQTNIGLDWSVMDKRLSGSLEFYEKYTNPLVVQLDLPSSTGVSSYPMNLGNMKTRGAEVIMKYSPIYNLPEQIVWTIGLNAGTYKSEYGGFDHTIDNLNEMELTNRTLIRYRDGYSPNALWAVRSLGIDPATGKEVFQKKNGQATFKHDFEDEIVVGNSTPDVEGVISSDFRYKDFSMGVHLRFRFGADELNNVLYNKVENIGRQEIANNQDRRALHDRWQKPGDVAEFKGISITENTPISSRFVQRKNELIGESIRLGYRVQNKKWLAKVRMESISFNAYMNDIFRASTIKVERGVSYPFARSVSFSVNVAF